MDTVLNWFRENGYAISFFVAGWCAFAFLDSLGKGNYGWAAFNAVLCYANIKMAKL